LKLALGTVQFGMFYGIANHSGEVTLHEARSILEFASESGIDTLDTAVMYGKSEERLGEIGVGGFRTISKLPEMPVDCCDPFGWVISEVEGSLRRLNVESLKGLLLHRPGQLLQSGGEELGRALLYLKESGLVDKIGASIYEPAELDALQGRFSLDIVQAPFNVLDRRLIDSGWLARLNAEGTELHVRSIFLQGLLLMAPKNRERKFARWQPLWDEWDSWLRNQRMTPLQCCIRYALSFNEIDRVVVGVDSVVQLRQILEVATASPTEPQPEIACSDIDLLNPSRWSGLV
jgi:aryl-alcohol dehydrogenase-like predicted oxidoreductase